MNDKNLKPCEHKFTQEEAKRGGLASAAARRERKTLREELIALLDTEVSDKNGNKITVRESISMAMIKQANNGNVRAFSAIRDTIGEMPAQKLDIAQVDFSALREVDYTNEASGEG